MINYEEMTEEEYLAHCKTIEFARPCVTVDMLIFSMNKEQQLELLLIKRGGHPHKGKWAIPGGFVEMDESLEEAAARELKEETNLDGIYLEQLYTFGEVERDKRTRVISVAYIALVPAGNLDFAAGDDAVDACNFVVKQEHGGFTLYSQERNLILTQEELAFDHKDIVEKGLERLKGKVVYSDIALELLRDKEKFTIYELQTIHEALTGEAFDVANFRRSFKKKFMDTGRVEKLEEKSVDFSRKPSSYYRLIK
ncbi:MAG: NUDIX hydrolase [Lachnospiraceae bacterium]|nr:NUDIX hydrolase [Lachnospiraceae bacterium]